MTEMLICRMQGNTQMINIAIFDDDVAMTATIEKMLYVIAKEQNIKISSAVFFDGSTLVANIRQGVCYDLIYLDIEMHNVNGINAAELIRNMEIPALIIYVSSYEKYLKELFSTEPFRFLSKPIIPEDFQAAFMAAYKRIRRKPEYFTFTYNKEYVKVLLDRIYFFESSNRIIHIHMADDAKDDNTDETLNRFYGKMSDVERQLSESNGRFIRIHQSYLVNFDYIRQMNFSGVTMSDGTQLQISEDRQKEVRIRFCRMAGMEGSGDE